MKLIAFCGKMGVGKSTAIDALHERDNKIANIKFADPLYDIQEYVYDKISSVYMRPFGFAKDRFLLQFIGTDWGRNKISETLWIDIWRSRVQSILSLKFPYTITCDDCRFDNEAEAVKSLGGIIIKITSNKNDSRIDTKTGIINHASEAGISEKYIDYTIENNDTLESYRNKLCDLYKIILAEQQT